MVFLILDIHPDHIYANQTLGRICTILVKVPLAKGYFMLQNHLFVFFKLLWVTCMIY
jgi:hypothetical protein